MYYDIWLSGFDVYCEFELLSLRCIERSRKLMEFCVSFRILNFIVGCCLLNSTKVSSMFAFFFGRLKGCHI